MTSEDCLPADFRGPTTTVTRIAAGFSGAGVYRVDAAGQSFVLKVAGEAENDADWHRALHIQRLAADAGLAPRIVHVDEAILLLDWATAGPMDAFYDLAVVIAELPHRFKYTRRLAAARPMISRRSRSPWSRDPIQGDPHGSQSFPQALRQPGRA